MEFAQEYARESWSLYSVGIGLVALRYTARIRRFGIRGLKVDDYVMANGIIWYTILCISFNQIASGGGSNFMTEADILALTPQTTKDRISGSKWVFVSEHSMLLTIWSMKICMIILYLGITQGLKQREWVKWVAGYVALSFVGSELALFLTCRPIQQYWAVPAADAQCSTYQYYEIIQASLNIPGDLAMLAIGIPILASLRMPTPQKAILLVIFSMGGFIVVASILTKLYCLVPSLISYVYMNWYFREASVAVYVTNLPTIWPLIRDVFPSIRNWGSRTKATGSSGNGNLTWGGSGSRGARMASKDYDLKSLGKNPETESQERINDSDSGKSSDPAPPLEIHRDMTYSVKSDLERGNAPPLHTKWQTSTVVNIVN